MLDEGDDPFLTRFAASLGMVIIEFNYLEFDLAKLIARCLGQSDLEAAKHADLGFQRKKDQIKSLIASLPTPLLRSRTSDLLNEAVFLADRRNRLVHAEFMPVVSPSGQVFGMRHRPLRDAGGPIPEGGTAADSMPEISARELDELGRKINLLAEKVRDLSNDIYDAMFNIS